MDYYERLSLLDDFLTQAYVHALDIGFVNNNDKLVREALKDGIDMCRKTVDALMSTHLREIRLDTREEKSDAARAENVIEWISVREKTPGESGRYLICDKDGTVVTADYYWDYDYPGTYWYADGDEAVKPVAWAYLPKPYEKIKGE